MSKNIKLNNKIKLSESDVCFYDDFEVKKDGCLYGFLEENENLNRIVGIPQNEDLQDFDFSFLTSYNPFSKEFKLILEVEGNIKYLKFLSEKARKLVKDILSQNEKGLDYNVLLSEDNYIVLFTCFKNNYVEEINFYYDFDEEINDFDEAMILMKKRNRENIIDSIFIRLSNSLGDQYSNTLLHSYNVLKKKTFFNTIYDKLKEESKDFWIYLCEEKVNDIIGQFVYYRDSSNYIATEYYVLTFDENAQSDLCILCTHFPNIDDLEKVFKKYMLEKGYKKISDIKNISFNEAYGKYNMRFYPNVKVVDKLSTLPF